MGGTNVCRKRYVGFSLDRKRRVSFERVNTFGGLDLYTYYRMQNTFRMFSIAKTNWWGGGLFTQKWGVTQIPPYNINYLPPYIAGISHGYVIQQKTGQFPLCIILLNGICCDVVLCHTMS